MFPFGPEMKSQSLQQKRLWSAREKNSTNIKISGETVADVLLNIMEIVDNFFSI
jgi:hypothetical protein